MVLFYFSEEVDQLAKLLGCRHMLTSVKEDVNVNAVFRHLASRCLAELRREEEEYTMSSNGLHPLTISEYYGVLIIVVYTPL